MGMSGWISGLVGAVLGFLSGLGIGGGSLLMLWLTQIVQTPQHQAGVMNLMCFLPCAAIATAFRWRACRPNWPLTLAAAAGGIAGALAGHWLGTRLDLEILKKLLGSLFLFCGLREMCYRDRKRR